MTNEEKIAAKKAEIANYERILGEYYGRWYDMGRRHLEELKRELAELEMRNKSKSRTLLQ